MEGAGVEGGEGVNRHATTPPRHHATTPPGHRENQPPCQRNFAPLKRGGEADASADAASVVRVSVAAPVRVDALFAGRARLRWCCRGGGRAGRGSGRSGRTWDLGGSLRRNR